MASVFSLVSSLESGVEFLHELENIVEDVEFNSTDSNVVRCCEYTITSLNKIDVLVRQIIRSQKGGVSL